MAKRAKPVDAVRARPGEYFLAAEHVEIGLQFRYFDALYEVVSEPKRWGVAWTATVKVIEGQRPGAEFNAMLHTGRKVDG